MIVMANTYTQVFTQAVFAVKKSHTAVLIPDKKGERIEKYICGIAADIQCKTIAI